MRDKLDTPHSESAKKHREGALSRTPLLHRGVCRNQNLTIGMMRMATMFATLIIGLIAGPAVSL
jgi:hypothetical protein